MKQVLVLFFSVAIGVIVFKGLVGEEEDSVKNTSGRVYEQRLKGYGQVP